MDVKICALLVALVVLPAACSERETALTEDSGASADGGALALADACANATRPSPTSLDAAAYDRTCLTADDCLGASFAPLACPGGCGPCATAAVSKAGAAALDEDHERAVAACRPESCSGHPSCGACRTSLLSCTAGQCELRVCDNGDCGDAGAGGPADAARGD
jgi:hypothetical protein